MSKYIWYTTWLIIILSILEIELDQPVSILFNSFANLELKRSHLNCNNLDSGNQSSCTESIYMNIQPNCWDTYMDKIIEFEPPIAAKIKEILDQIYNIYSSF